MSHSDHVERVIPDKPWPRVALFSLILVGLAVIGWEVLARAMYHEAGTYDSGFDAMWAEERRKLDDPDNEIKLVLAGSSRMLWAADLDIMETQFGTRPLQLALPGTSPSLFVKDLVDNTDFNGLVLVGATPFLFNRFSKGAFGREALEWYESPSPSKWVGEKIHRLLSDYIAFLDEGFPLFELLTHYTNFPNREGVWDPHEDGWKLGNVYDDRQTDMWAPVEEVGSFDNVHVTNFWMGGLRRDPPIPDTMVAMGVRSAAFYEPLIEAMRDRGGDIVFIRMPGSGKYLDKDLLTDYDGLTWTRFAEGVDAVSINTMDHPELSTELEIPEWSHLSRASQDVWSERIVRHIEDQYMALRGKSIYETMETPEPPGR